MNTVQPDPGEGMHLATIAGPTSIQTTSEPSKDLGPFILLQDDFSDPNSGWEISDGDYGSVGYDQGGYIVTTKVQDETMWGVANKTYSDIRMEVDVNMLAAPENGNNAFGIDCRIQENGDGYSFHISSDGYYSIVLFQDQKGSQLVDWTESSAVLLGNETNHLTAICQGNQFTFLVNDIQVAQVTDDSFSQGDISLSAVSFETAPTSILFDNIIVQQLGTLPN